MPIDKSQPSTIEKQQPNTIEISVGMLPPPTEVPGTPTFILTALPAAIGLRISQPTTGGRAMGYRYRVRRRNAADTAWESVQAWVDIGRSRSATITQYSTNQLIEVGRQYQVKVISYNIIGDGAETAYQDVTPVAVPAQPPGIPTFTFAALRYEYDATADTVSTTVSFVPVPNADGVGVTHWLFRYRRVGTSAWATQTIIAQPELDTAYGFRLNQSELGQTYEVQVASRNSDGDSAYTSSQNIVITIPVADVPAFSIVYNPFVWDDALAFQLDPVAPVNPLLPLTGYDWRFRQVGTQTWTTASSNISPVYASSAPSSAIGNIIEIQMRAVNGASLSDWSASQRLQIIDVPNRPDLFLTAQAGGFDVRIVNSPAGYRAVGFGFRYREQGTTDWTGGSTLEIRNLDGLTAYEVQAWTENPAGRSLSVSRTVTTLAVMRRAGKVFMFGGDTVVMPGELTGGFERVGSARQFGVNENFPEGLTFIGNTLYMLGDALYTLDQTTGIATRIGSATAFGVSETLANGIAAIGNTLYMVGATTDVLYTLDQTTGIATRIGSATAFGVGETNPRGITSIGNTLYMVGSGNNVLYTLDQTTGVATRVGSATAFGLNRVFLTGIASIGDTLYAVGSLNNVLYTLDQTTGIATRVGSATAFGVSETDPRGLAAIDNTLYMVGASNDALYRSITTPATTVQKPPQHHIIGGKSFSIGV